MTELRFTALSSNYNGMDTIAKEVHGRGGTEIEEEEKKRRDVKHIEHLNKSC